MKITLNYLFILALLSISSISYGFEYTTVGKIELPCYSRAMIGFDSVINSRLGVPAEHALELSLLKPVSSSTTSLSKTYSAPMLKTILDAYLWQESPHSYAVKVFYRCAQSQGPMRSAKNE